MTLRSLVSLVAFASLASLASCRPALPPAVQDEVARTPRGQATVVFFTDFECPYCRRTHAALAPLLAERRGRVRLVFKHVPLRRHPDARDAARAAICSESFVREPLAYAEALARAVDLGEQANVELAASLGADRGLFERCLRDPSTEARLEADEAAFDAAAGDGVPLLFVGDKRLEGAQRRSALEPALDEAIRAAAP